MRPAAAVALLGALAAAALLAEHTISVASIAAVLLVACLRAPAKRRWPYLVGTLFSAAMVVVVTPFVAQLGGKVVWSGPSVPVLGRLDVTTTELANSPSGEGGFNTGLKPQRAWNYEIGARGSAGRRFGYTLAVFQADVRDALIPYEIAAPRFYYRNAGSTRHRGMELSADLAVTSGVSLNAGVPLERGHDRHAFLAGGIADRIADFPA